MKLNIEKALEYQATESLRSYWNVSYMPGFDGPGIIEFVFKGTEEELNDYMNTHHSCSCCDYDEEGNYISDWFSKQISGEYLIEKVSYD